MPKEEKKLFYEVLLILVVKGGILELERWYGHFAEDRCNQAIEYLKYDLSSAGYKNTWSSDEAGVNGLHYACVPSLRESTPEDSLKDLTKKWP